jgi:hypothetical protein
MIHKSYIHEQVNAQFGHRDNFTREELFRFFRQFEPDLNEGTFGWRIYDLKKKHIIKGVLRSVYTLESKQQFKPEINQFIKQLSGLAKETNETHYYNIWTTQWLNEMIELQATSFLYIVEVEKEAIERVFYRIKENSRFRNVFLKPNDAVIETYVSEVETAIIVKPMVSRAPTMTVKNSVLPTLEKIMVDLFCDDKLFFAYQGRQLISVYERCIDKYVINFSRIAAYARRRKREEAIKHFISSQPTLQNKVKDIL